MARSKGGVAFDLDTIHLLLLGTSSTPSAVEDSLHCSVSDRCQLQKRGAKAIHFELRGFEKRINDSVFLI
jgi:hypothetical protein